MFQDGWLNTLAAVVLAGRIVVKRVWERNWTVEQVEYQLPEVV